MDDDRCVVCDQVLASGYAFCGNCIRGIPDDLYFDGVVHLEYVIVTLRDFYRERQALIARYRSADTAA